jgi:hypothetical protein
MFWLLGLLSNRGLLLNQVGVGEVTDGFFVVALVLAEDGTDGVVCV